MIGLAAYPYIFNEEYYLANDLGWLGVVNRAQVLLHRSVIVTPLVQEIAILAINGILL